MSHHVDQSEGFWAFFTGFCLQIVGIITFDTFWAPLILAFAGGFLGLIGKRLGEILLKRIQRKWKHKALTHEE